MSKKTKILNAETKIQKMVEKKVYFSLFCDLVNFGLKFFLISGKSLKIIRAIYMRQKKSLKK
jgi:hypothetical protein